MIKEPEDDEFEQLSEKLAASWKDAINPDHYKVGGIETIDFMEAKATPEEFAGHLRLTAIKYLSRAGHKHDDVIEEYSKSLWYIERLIEFIKKQQANQPVNQWRKP